MAEAAAAGAASKGKLVLMYSYLLIYIVLSSGQIFFNKWVLSDSKFNFPYPVGLTLLHMVFSTVLCFLVVRVFKWVKLQQGMTYEIYISSVLPIGATFALTLWLGNTAYLYISVSFAQMLKAIMPVAVFLLGTAFGLEELSLQMMGTMSVISGGVLIASYGEVNFNWIGVVYMMGGVVGEAFRLIFIEILLKRKGMKLDPITMMYYVSPCSALCLFVPWLVLEKPKLDATLQWHFDPVIMVLNALCTFALNVSVFLVISHTSALTIRVAGVVKDWVVVLVSVYLFADTKLTIINVFGYIVVVRAVLNKVPPNYLRFWGVHNESSLRELTQALCIAAIGGVYLYNAQKLKEAAAVASNASSTNLEEEQHLLGLRSAPIKHKQSGIPELEMEEWESRSYTARQ